MTNSPLSVVPLGDLIILATKPKQEAEAARDEERRNATDEKPVHQAAVERRPRSSLSGKSAVESPMPNLCATSSSFGRRHSGIWLNLPHELIVVRGMPVSLVNAV